MDRKTFEKVEKLQKLFWDTYKFLKCMDETYIQSRIGIVKKYDRGCTPDEVHEDHCRYLYHEEEILKKLNNLLKVELTEKLRLLKAEIQIYLEDFDVEVK